MNFKKVDYDLADLL